MEKIDLCNKEELEKIFYEFKKKYADEYDLRETPYSMYHGTNKFSMNLSIEEKNKYTNAFKEYIKTIIDNELESNLGYNPIINGFKNENENFKYDSLYVTTSLSRANRYADYSKYCGELGTYVHDMFVTFKEKNITVPVSDETMNILTELFDKIDNMPFEPVVLKYTKENFADAVKCMEDGREISLFKMTSELSINMALDFQESFRLKDGIELKDFEIIDSDEEYAINKEKNNEICINLRKMFYDYLVDNYGPFDEGKEFMIKINIARDLINCK